MVRAFLPALLLLAAAGCAPRPPTSTGRADAAALAACKASTNRAFDRQNRYLLSERDQTDNPFSTSGDTGITTRGLTQRYDYDTQLASCLTASGAPDQANSAATSTPPTARTSTSLSQ